MSNIVGANFKKYVADQIKIRQSRLGKLERDNETLSWSNSNTAYIALASSVDIKNTPIYQTTVSVTLESPGVSANVDSNVLNLSDAVDEAGGTNAVLNDPNRSITDPVRWTAQLESELKILFLPQLVEDTPTSEKRGGSGDFSDWTDEMLNFRTDSDSLGQDMEGLSAESFARLFDYALDQPALSVNPTYDDLIFSLVDGLVTVGRFEQVKKAYKKYFPNKFNGDLIAALEDDGVKTITDKDGFLIINAGDSAENELFPSTEVEADTTPIEFKLNIDGKLKVFNSPYKKTSAYITSAFGGRPNVNVAQAALNESARFAIQDRIAQQTPQEVLNARNIDPVVNPSPPRQNPPKPQPVYKSTKIGETKEGTKRLQTLNLSEAYLGNGVAKNLVLTNGTTKVENDGTRTYKAGVADTLSTFNDYVYGFGGDADWGLVAMPGLQGVDVKSKNMGSLREATVKIRANSERQFSLIDILYCRIGYTMFLEWGNSLFINNNDTYISNPIQGGVQSLIPTFLNPGKDACFDTNTGLLKKIETNREKSGGNYDAFLGRVANFSWEFVPEGYYTVTLKLISIGDIIESLKIDESISDVNIATNQPPVQAQPSANSALESFLAVAATPTGTTSYDLNFFQRGQGGGNDLEYNLNITKSQLVADSTYREAGIGTSFEVVNQTTGGDYSAELNYDRSKTNSAGKVIAARAIFAKEVYHYVRFGDILDFIKTKLLIYNPACENKPIIDIDTNIETNLCYATKYNISADPSKVMVRSDLPDLDKLRGWASSFNVEGERNWNYPIKSNDIFSSTFVDGGSNQINPFKVENGIDFNGKKVPYAGKIMNIYFEYRYLLEAIQSNRDKETGNVSLLNFLNEVLKTANECLGGINKLTTRIVDDNRLEIYDQNPIYGTQIAAPKKSIFNLYGVKTNTGSFVRNFSIQTELTNEFATQVTIGAQAQGSKDTTDALALSNWNYGLIDRIIPEKLASSEFTKTKTPSTYENIINVRNQLMLMWCAYAEGTKFTNIKRPDLTEDQVTDFAKYLELQTGVREQDRFWDLDIDQANVKEEKAYYFAHFPTKRYKEFVKLQKDFFALLHINSDYNSNQQGMLPINISVELDGLSGIRIYDQLPVDTRFIPNYYPQTLYWIIKGVSHRIIDNKWLTTLETIAVPKLPDLDSDNSSTKSNKIDNSSYITIPLNDISSITEDNYISESTVVGGDENIRGAGGTGQTGGGVQGYGNAHTNPQTESEKQNKEDFITNVKGFTQPTTCAWVPLIDTNTATSRVISLTSLPQSNRSVDVYKNPTNHYGADFGSPVGTQVLAPCDGEYKYYGELSGAGLGGSVAQKLSDGTILYHCFFHLSSNVKADGAVKAGEVIALSGNTGNSTGPHLHYEIKINSMGLDCQRYSVVDWLNNNTPAPGCQLLSGTGVSGNTPSSSPGNSTTSNSLSSGDSTAAFYRIARKLKNIFAKVDGQGAGGGPLLKSFTSYDQDKAVQETLKNWFSTNAEVKADYAKLDATAKTVFDIAMADLEDQIDDTIINDVIFQLSNGEKIIIDPDFTRNK